MKVKIKHAILIGMILLVSGCASVASTSITAPEKTFSISSPEKICLVIPEDAKYEGVPYSGSGRRVAEKTANALSDKISLEMVATENALRSCQDRGLSYVLRPEILYYENRASGWSGRPDVIKIKTTLLDLKTSTETSFMYEGKTNIGVSMFFEWGNPPPYELLDEKYKENLRRMVFGQ